MFPQTTHLELVSILRSMVNTQTFSLKNKQQNPHEVMQVSSQSPSLKASDFRDLKYHMNINEKNL